ncbi:MAG: nitroreductase family protein, partial [Deltaproteobacteria bacterium]|nr:nitroreductase family protein [Deltaproteobacteria bacterium]
MDVGEALKRRRSTRHFEPEGVLLPRELIEDLIQEACQAPSEFDLQPWRFIVVRDRERKEVLYQCCFKQPMIRDASAVVIVLGDTRGHERAPQAVEEWVAQGVIAAPEAPRVEASIRAAYDGSDWARMLLAVRNPCFAAMSLMLLATGNGIATSPVVAFAEEALRRA